MRRRRVLSVHRSSHMVPERRRKDRPAAATAGLVTMPGWRPPLLRRQIEQVHILEIARRAPRGGAAAAGDDQQVSGHARRVVGAGSRGRTPDPIYSGPGPRV
eukprot:scaffold12691_cov108-Isochrysis_galbana.AAC.5